MSGAFELHCPRNMVFDARAILENGEYDLPIDFDQPPSVLDIGACCGAFSVFSGLRWPGAQVLAYEPHPSAFEYLVHNARPWMRMHQKAVVGPGRGRHVKIWTGKSNLGCSSLWGEGETDVHADEAHLVEAICASTLPHADILKIDTEGCEPEILEVYDLSQTVAVMYEWHRREDRRMLEMLLEERGFTLWSQLQRAPGLGVARWVREDRGALPK